MILASYGQPLEIVEKDGVQLPVYDFEGFKDQLQKKDDKTYVINFWATWCKPCVEEMPHFIQLAGELPADQYKFLFVSLDFRKNLDERLIPFVKENGLEGRTIMLHDPDANSWISQVDADWGGSIPATLVYNSQKREFFEKKFSYEELKQVLESF